MPIKLLFRLIIPLLAFGVAVWMSMQMMERTKEELLWGWRPFFLMISVWIGVLSLIKGFAKVDAQAERRLLLSVLSGILLSLGFPPSPLTPLMFIGLVPLLMIEGSLREQYGHAVRWKLFKYAFNTFFIWNVGTTWWVLNTSFLPGIFANLMNAVFMAIVFMLFHQACALLHKRYHIVALASFWIAFEFLHTRWELSWPWLTLGHTFSQYPSWIQWYEYTGVFGGSLWLLLANYWLYRWYVTGRRLNKQFVGIALLIIIPIAAGILKYSTIELPDGDTEVGVVQPNFEPHYQKFDESQKKQLERFLALSRSALTDSTDYLVFPETSFGFIRLNDLEEDFRIAELRKLLDEYPSLHIVTGLESYRMHQTDTGLKSMRTIIDRYGDTVLIDVQNSAIQLSKDQPADLYFKSKLVPGAEFLPYRNALPFLKPLVDMLQGSMAGLTGQESRDVFHSTTTDVAPVICYESIYGEYVGDYVKNGAEIIFIVTNDGWWDDSPGHIQHLKFGAMRAIEHRRPIARSANTGISCFINIRGDILQPTKYEETISIKGMVAPGRSTTFYSKWGDVLARIAVGMAIIGFICMMFIGIKRRTGR